MVNLSRLFQPLDGKGTLWYSRRGAGVARVLMVLVGILIFMVVLGGCDFFGSNMFPMYLGFTDATFDVRALVREVYPNARGFDIREAKFARYIVNNVDYSKVNVFVEVFDQGRLLAFLDPVSLKPVRVVDEVEMSNFTHPLPPNEQIEIFPRITVTHVGFLVGEGLFDPLNIQIDPTRSTINTSGTVLVHTFQNTGTVSFSDETVVISRFSPFTIEAFDDLSFPAIQTIDLPFDSVSTPATIIDAYFSSNGVRLNLLIDVEGSGVRLYSIPDYNFLFVPGSTIVDLSDMPTGISLNTVNIFMSDRQPIWLVKDMIVDTSRDNSNRGYQLSAIRTNNEPAGSITVATNDWSRYEVLDIDKGDQDKSRWWLLYDRQSGLLYKNRVWWSQ